MRRCSGQSGAPSGGARPWRWFTRRRKCTCRLARPGPAAVTSLCRLPWCERPSRSAGDLCELHRKRRQRGAPLDAPARERLGPAAALLERALEFADVSAEDDLAYHLALARLFLAAKRYAREEVGDTADVVPNVG